MVDNYGCHSTLSFLMGALFGTSFFVFSGCVGFTVGFSILYLQFSGGKIRIGPKEGKAEEQELWRRRNATIVGNTDQVMAREKIKQGGGIAPGSRRAIRH